MDIPLVQNKVIHIDYFNKIISPYRIDVDTCD